MTPAISQLGYLPRFAVATAIGSLVLLIAEPVSGQGGYGGVALPIPHEIISELPTPAPLGLSSLAMIPTNNMIRTEVVDLGRKLFFDKNLSRDRTIACASCHRPELAFADTTRLSGGVLGRMALRNTPTIANRVYGGTYFFDGRATTLEDAVLMPIQDTREMSMTISEVVQRVAADDAYRPLFMSAFMNAGVTQTQLAAALASYVRTLRAGNSAVDRYEAGNRAALSASAIRGRELFAGPANCASCHSGSNFSNEAFLSNGASSDPGRFAVTNNPAHRGKFKVPTLRDIALTAPYMHDGRFATLDQVVDFYDRGGDQIPGGTDNLRRLNLSATQKADLVAFLRALTSETRTF